MQFLFLYICVYIKYKIFDVSYIILYCFVLHLGQHFVCIEEEIIIEIS